MQKGKRKILYDKDRGTYMEIKKIQVLTLASLILLTNSIYATTTNNVEISSEFINTSINDNVLIEGRVTSDQTLTDTDGDGYFAFKIPSETKSGRFSFVNNGKSVVDVNVYSATTDSSVWSARVSPGRDAISSTSLSLPAGKYYFKVVSYDGSALNVTCSAGY